MKCLKARSVLSLRQTSLNAFGTLSPRYQIIADNKIPYSSSHQPSHTNLLDLGYFFSFYLGMGFLITDQMIQSDWMFGFDLLLVWALSYTDEFFILQKYSQINKIHFLIYLEADNTIIKLRCIIRSSPINFPLEQENGKWNPIHETIC